jgi:hypothetical protein
MGDMRNDYKIFLVIYEQTRTLERPRRRWKDNIKMYHKEIAWEGIYWIHLV